MNAGQVAADGMSEDEATLLDAQNEARIEAAHAKHEEEHGGRSRYSTRERLTYSMRNSKVSKRSQERPR